MGDVGNKQINPNGTTTRAMIVTILWRLEGSPVVNYAMDFEDVESGKWYTEAIRWAASEKIVEGYGNGDVYKIYAWLLNGNTYAYWAPPSTALPDWFEGDAEAATMLQRYCKLSDEDK